MIRAFVLAVLSAAVVLPAHAQDMTLRMLQFYESGFKPAAKDQRRYVSLLPKSSTRFVYWEMTVRNNLHNVRDHTHTIVARWYRPDGSQLGRTQQVFKVRSGWSEAWASHGWGFRQPGQWAPGKYRVDIVVDGQLYARRHFLIYDDAKIDPDNQQFAFTRIRLFESGYRPDPVGKRQYMTSFVRSQTRYIYAEIAGRNQLYGKRDQYPIVMVRFFKDDGAYAGEIIINRAIVRAGWRSALLAGGWGSRSANSWAVGNYRAEVWTSNDNKVGETRFSVRTANAPPAANPQDDQKGPEGMTPDDKPRAKTPDADRPPADKLPEAPPGAKPTPDTPKQPDKSRDLEELEKL